MWKFQEGWKGCLNLFHCIFPIISSGTSSILSFLSKSPFSFSHWFIFPSAKRPGPRILKKLLNIKTFKISSLNLNLKHNIAIHSQDLTASIISGPCRCARPASGNPSLLWSCSKNETALYMYTYRWAVLQCSESKSAENRSQQEE